MTRTFKAIRNVDHTGVSGEGHIADGVLFEDGTTVLRWRTNFRSTAVYESFEHMQAIHGHNGATQFVFNGEPKPGNDIADKAMRMYNLVTKLASDLEGVI
jgi:hypothetical protein